MSECWASCMLAVCVCVCVCVRELCPVSRCLVHALSPPPLSHARCRRFVWSNGASEGREDFKAECLEEQHANTREGARIVGGGGGCRWSRRTKFVCFGKTSHVDLFFPLLLRVARFPFFCCISPCFVSVDSVGLLCSAADVTCAERQET